MVRISNAIGAMLALLIGIGFAGYIAPAFHSWITTSMTGDMQLLLVTANITVTIFLILALPILIATQDSEE